MERRNLKLSLQYDGTDYSGWQVQPNGPTIQGLLTEVLTRIEGMPVTVYGAGRTDAGVHANQQVANYFTARTMTCEKFRRAINGNLPRDIRVTNVEQVSADFHARFSAQGKHYRYQVARSEFVSPFDYRYFYHYPYLLDIASMRLAAQFLEGEHDFAAFATACEQETTTRTITGLEIIETGDKLIFEVSGNGFLRHMVRTLVGTLIEVGRGKIAVADMETILQHRDRSKAGPTAPACGLILYRVKY